MTISTTTSSVAYAGDGATTSFAVPFAFFDAANLQVIERTNATGAEVTKLLSTHYTVSGGNGSSGTVTAVTAPPATVRWTILRNTAKTQLIDLQPNGPFAADTVERALDRVTAVVQEIDRDTSRALRFPVTDVGATLPAAALRANRVFGFDSSGAPLMLSGLDKSSDTVTPTGAVTAQTLAQIASRETWIDDYIQAGDGDDASLAIQRAHDAAVTAGANGVVLRFRSRKYWLRSACAFTVPMFFIGQGGQEHYEAAVTAPPASAIGTWFCIEDSGFTPFTYNGAASADYSHTPRGSGAVGISIWQKHSTPGVGWSATDYPPVFDFKATGGQLFLDDIFCLAVNKLAALDNGGRHYIGRVNGQVWRYVARVSETYDIPRFGKWHLWNFWSGNANVLAWQQANTYPLDVLRCDGFQMDTLFCIYAAAAVRFSDGSNGVSNTGSCMEFSISHLYADMSQYALLMNGSGVSVNPTTGWIGHLYHLGQAAAGGPLTGSIALLVNGSNTSLTVGRFRTLGCSAAVRLRGLGGNRVTLLDPAEVKYNWGTTGGAAFQLDAAGAQGPNTLFLNAVPVPAIDLGTSGVLTSVGSGSVVASGVWDNDTAGSANFVRGIRAASGSAPGITAQGADTNIPLNLFGKGTGNVVMANAGGTGLVVGATAGSVNAVSISGNSTGAAAVVGVTGEANASVILQGTGTGGAILGSSGGRASFFGGSPVVRQTLPATPTTTEIRTVLANLNLIVP